MFNLIALWQVINPPVVYVAPPKPAEVVDINALIALKSKEYGLDVVLVKKIIQCESSGLVGAINGPNRDGSYDRGLLQLNTVHNTQIESLGLDPLDPVDNLDFGLKMMQKQGTRPWNSSRKCWQQ